MNALSATEIKRKGMGAVDTLLERGPVYVIRNKQPKYVVLKESDYLQLMNRHPVKSAGTFSIPDIAGQIRSVWGDRMFSREETEQMNRAEREWEDA